MSKVQSIKVNSLRATRGFSLFVMALELNAMHSDGQVKVMEVALDLLQDVYIETCEIIDHTTAGDFKATESFCGIPFSLATQSTNIFAVQKYVEGVFSNPLMDSDIANGNYAELARCCDLLETLLLAK